MRVGPTGVAAAAMAILASASVARAADPASVQTPIKGSDTMGDKGRTGPDGWSWAPQARDQAPGDKDNQTAANGRGAANSQPDGDTGKKLAPGDDPGTPVATEAHGPGTVDRGAARPP